MNLENMPLSAVELARYNRHIILPQFGLEGQQKLKAAKVLVVGAGGLGCPVLLYLAAAGIGTIGIIDFDVVNESNLQRQVLFDVNDIGRPKVEAARRRLEKLNPHVNIITYDTSLTSANALNILEPFDLVADGSDNFPTRYLVNDACVMSGKPYVYASIFQFEGQVSVFNYRNHVGETGPNYRDLYPTPPPAGAVQACGEAGVLGVLPGVIGTLQALEVIKLITGSGKPLSGRYFMLDALSMETKTFRIKRDPANPLNGTHTTITSLIDYDNFCSVRKPARAVKEISCGTLREMKTKGEDFQLIDVREPHEYERQNIGADLIPLSRIREKVPLISREKMVVMHCKSGSRSISAIIDLEENFGFTNLYQLSGGLTAYLDNVAADQNK